MTQIALFATLAAATPMLFAQQTPGGSSTLRPGRPASQPGGPSAAADQQEAQRQAAGQQQQQPQASQQQAGQQQQQPAGQQQSVAQIISANDKFSTLEKALQAAKLEQTLSDQQGSFTIFAPTDEAFENLPAGTLDKLLQDKNRDKLRTILLNHVVSGKKMAADLQSGNVKTMSGETIQITAAAGEVQVAGSQVTLPDQQAQNGVVHTIGEVLIPRSIDLKEL